MFLFSIGLTLFDLQISGDYSAYAVGIFMTSFLYRIDWKRYVLFVVSGLLIFEIAYIFFFKNASSIECLLPLVIFTIVSIYMVFYREKTRMQLLVLKVRLEDSALKDHLTGLYNRRHLFDILPSQIALFGRYGKPLTVLLLDIDYFKRINDELGHNVGDVVLREFACLITLSIRETDTAFRYGGEEFFIILSDTNGKNSSILAERLRRAIEQFSFPDVPWNVTASIGIAELLKGEDEDKLIEKADKNLYAAKNSGRNRVVI